MAVVGDLPVLGLAMAVWEAFPGRAHAVLRGRIRTTDPVTEVDRAVVRVAAKRVVHADPGDGEATVDGPLPPVRDLGPARKQARERIRRAAWAPEPRVVRPGDRAAYVTGLVAPPAPVRRVARDRPVAAALFDGDGRVRWAARNAGARNRVLHAELVLLLSWTRAHGPVPAGWQLATSLQSCRMCAALAVALAAGPIAVGYAAPDPGRFARGTALQALGWEHPL